MKKYFLQAAISSTVYVFIAPLKRRIVGWLPKKEAKVKQNLLLLCFFCLSFASEGQEQLTEPLPSVFLDHVYIVLDGQTYNDIARSKFMQHQFASFREQTIVLDAQSHSAAYINGEQTYIEIFEADKDPRFKLGMIGIAFNIEHVGGSELLLQRLNTKFVGQANTELSTVRIDTIDVPIFYATYIDYADDSLTLSTWVMEYHKDFFKSRLPEFKPEDGVTRKQAMARSFKSDMYFRDIYEVTVALNDLQSSRLINELETFGYTISADGKNKICQGPDIKFIITPITNSIGGITELKMSLLRKKRGKKKYKFGAKSVLTFKSNKASWVF